MDQKGIKAINNDQKSYHLLTCGMGTINGIKSISILPIDGLFRLVYP